VISPALSQPAAPIVIELVLGRWRRYRHLLVAALGALGAWAWFGLSGLMPVLLWTWYRCPVPGRVVYQIVGPITALRLGPYRTLVVGPRRQRVEIFHDELSRPALAALRRALKAASSARNRAQDVEAV